MVVIAKPAEHLLVAKLPDIENAGKFDLEQIDLEHVDLLIEPEIVETEVEPKEFDLNHFVHEKYDGPAFKVVSIPCKGSGMIATKKIYPGDVIIAEKPAIFVPNDIFEDVDLCESFLENKINLMNSQDRELVLSLTDCREIGLDDYWDPNPYAGMFYTNAMHFDDDTTVLCPIMARANHSCRPNSEFVARPDLGTHGLQHLTANYIIMPGEEITISYMAMAEEGSETKEIRQKYLRKLYSFQCTCRTCTLQDKELEDDEALRESIKELQAAGVEHLDATELKSLITQVYQINGKHSYILELFHQLYRSTTVGSYSRVECAVNGFTIAVNLCGVGSKEANEWKNLLEFHKSVNLLILKNASLSE